MLTHEEEYEMLLKNVNNLSPYSIGREVEREFGDLLDESKLKDTLHKTVVGILIKKLIETRSILIQKLKN